MNLLPLRAVLVMFVLASVACADFDQEKAKLCNQFPERCGDADGSMGDWTGGALNVTIDYSGFTRGCVTVTATDSGNVKNTSSLSVAIPAKTPGTVSVAVFGKKSWGRALSVTTQLRESDCSGTLVGDPQEMKAQVPEEGTRDVPFTVRAIDLDGDRFFSSADAEGVVSGTDCRDDDPAVNPKATEVCNGRDDNCTLGESDATDKKTWYTDADGDGYGSPQVEACVQPAGAVDRGGDCNDNDAQVRPERAEFRCDGKDDNCNGMSDEDFSVDSDCKDELKCAGKIACASTPSQTTCARLPSENPVVWYVDGDGDGFKGQDVGVGCEAPVAGAVTQSEDCDESSVYVRNGLAEVCDRLDNNCSGAVDEGCGTLAWTTEAGVGGTADVTAIARYDEGRKAWMVGPNKLVHFDSTTGPSGTVTSYTHSSCLGNWKAGWASADGRVFAVGDSGKITTRLPNSDLNCFTSTVPGSASMTTLYGITGIEQFGVGATVYAVASNGKIFKWREPYSPTNENLTEFGSVPDNLRAVASAGSEGSLLAVGVDANNKAVAYRYDTASSSWMPDLQGGAFGGLLKGIHVTDSRFAYAAGDNGLVLKRSGGVWTSLPTVFEPNGVTRAAIRDVLAFSEKGIYVATSEGRIHFYDGSAWTTAYSGANPLSSLDGPSPTRIVAAGESGTVVNFRAPAPVP
ncbi:putative lipoprotein [Corallococcus coralloides DSM 2259]|uniref:Putative lipoprotein n=1 Tax=Corallococcus coralloides (strain ATCC 25202 / DSM 2259 / NBRC 100086 / M2) TaxID=1144275 RepID=H8N105_CORCM|nr:putative metal-binding motif-containing protein [Corallococcus coralloides]AFE07179.1 putative lipoprotein [Corallococcus coralloides DSM 2259]